MPDAAVPRVGGRKRLLQNVFEGPGLSPRTSPWANLEDSVVLTAPLCGGFGVCDPGLDTVLFPRLPHWAPRRA